MKFHAKIDTTFEAESIQRALELFAMHFTMLAEGDDPPAWHTGTFHIAPAKEEE